MVINTISSIIFCIVRELKFYLRQQSKTYDHLIIYGIFSAEDTPSQQQAALKPKQNSQQPATENDQNVTAIGATSQSPIGSANPQQSQNSLNNSQHQMVWTFQMHKTNRSVHETVSNLKK